MTQEFDAATRAVLDHYTVPLPRADLADAIVAAAEASPATTVWPRSASRSGWARRTVIGSVMMLSAVSAAAAAGGWFGERAVKLPVISAIATVMPEIVKAKPKAKAETRVVAKAIPKPVPPPTFSKPNSSPAPDVAVPAVVPPEAALKMSRQDARKERFADTLIQRLDMRDARRASRGLAPNTERERALLQDFRTAKSIDERQAARAALRQLRIERRARLQGSAGEMNKEPAEQNELATLRRADRMRAFARRPVCTAEQSNAADQYGCRVPRRTCADIPAGAWTPPRCRAQAPTRDER